MKLIGATAHYVTADLDEGPIIEQDVARVTTQRPDYVEYGRAWRWRQIALTCRSRHFHRRVFLNGDRTVVFS